MKAGTELDAFPNSYEGDPVAHLRESDEPPKTPDEGDPDPVPEEDEDEDQEDGEGGQAAARERKRPTVVPDEQPEADDDGLAAAMARLNK
jgi:hypothetical protein